MAVNEHIKSLAAKEHVHLWKIAARFGITDSQFSRWLRSEFSEERKKQAIQYIHEIAESQKGGK